MAHLRSRPSEVIAWRLLANGCPQDSRSSRSPTSIILVTYSCNCCGEALHWIKRKAFRQFKPRQMSFSSVSHILSEPYCPASSRILLGSSAKPPSQIIQPHRDTTYAASIIPAQAPSPGTGRIRPGTFSGLRLMVWEMVIEVSIGISHYNGGDMAFTCSPYITTPLFLA